ncbi:MAG TPA: hypothetical protein VNF07_01780 [Acidimicrobiales bacterium]|nr:hypothetical protein [Acidimicrobiales bacterium]
MGGHAATGRGGTRRARGGGRLAAAAALFGGAAALLVPAAAHASTRPALKPDFGYFAGKTITFIAPAAPGGIFDAIPRTLGPLMASYLHCTVNVVNVPNGNTLPGQDQAASAPANGLTLGVMNILADLENDVKGVASVSFPIKKVGFIGGVPSSDSVWISAPSQASLANFKDVITTTTPFTALDVTSGSVDAQIRVLLGAYGAHVRIVTGYQNAASQVQGFLRGDGPLMAQSNTALEATIESGQARPILQSTKPQPAYSDYKQLKPVPTFASFLASHPPTTAAGRAAMRELITLVASPTPVFVPAGVPANIRLALTDAMRSALNQRAAQTQEDHFGLPHGFVFPQVIENDIATGAKHDSIMARYLG